MAHTPGFDLVRRLFAVATWAHQNDIPEGEAEARFDEMLVERRAVLRGLAGAAAAAAVTPLLAACGSAQKPAVATPPPEQPAPRDPREVAIAVIGGGMSGLHCAYRLKQQGCAVTVYEAQKRTGGRMWTSRDRFEGLIFELGGELIDSTHKTMFALAKEFGITLDDRRSFETEGMVRETYYLTGKKVPAGVLLKQTIAVAPIMNEQVQAAEADPATMKKFSEMSMKAWLDEFVPVAKYRELHHVMRIAFVGEYGLEADQQSALNLHYLFGIDSKDEFLLFGDSDERWHTHGGNDLITTALAERLPGSIQHGAKLVRVSGPLEGPLDLTFETEGGPLNVEAEHVVFALPFSTLRHVDLTGLALSADKRRAIAELGYGTNTKVMGEFAKRPWWKKHKASGLLTTDLGVQSGWDSTIGQDAEERGVWTNFLGGDQGQSAGEGTPAEWYAKIIGDLDKVWPGSKKAWTGNAERMHWPSFPWARGSYTCYKPGQWEFWSKEGVREGNVHFCGEHCSLDFQGWMEGAAETGGLVAAEVLDDLGIAHSPALVMAVGSRMYAGHACYHGDVRQPKFEPRARRLANYEAFVAERAAG